MLSRPFKRKAAQGLAALVVLLALVPQDPLLAAARLDLYSGDLEGEGWRAAGVSAWAELGPGGAVTAGLDVAELELPAGVVRGIRLRCPRLERTARAFRCPAARIEPGDLPGLPPLEGALAWDGESGVLRWDLGGSRETGGRMRVRGRLDDGEWSLQAEAESLALAGPSPPDGASPAWSLSGTLDLDAQARGGAGGLEALRLSFRGVDLSGGNPEGTRAFEGLAMSGRLELAGGETLSLDGRLTADAGGAYLEPVYADLSERPLELELTGEWTGEFLRLAQLRYRQEGVLTGAGSALIRAGEDGWSVVSARLTAPEIRLPGAYEVLFQPFLATTDLGDLATAGRLSGELAVADGELESLSLRLDEAHLDDRQNRLALYGVDGRLAWRAGGRDRGTPVDLAWDGGYVYGIPFGRSALRMVSGPEGWALAGPVEIPVLDGALEIDLLELGQPAEKASAAIEARLRPVSMRALSRVLDWPPLSGTLSGEIPSMSYRDGVLTLGGELTARVFDGTVRVRDLRVDDPLAENARLQAEMELSGLDLERVTEAFSFGLITGRLDGHVRGLQMIGWRPVAFDARLYTPRDDPTRHRISQRAVDNIASLGGGGASPLASGFLRFFDDFSYRRMALGCRLVDDVCRMDGLEPTEGGYLILEGKGLPRIEIIGHARRVSWPTLVAQLEAIIESEGPTVE